MRLYSKANHIAGRAVPTETAAPPLPVLTAVPRRAVIVFLILACSLAWLVVLPLWLGGTGLRNPLTGILLPVMMFTPLVSVLVVVFFVQKPRPRPLPEFLIISTPLKTGKDTRPRCMRGNGSQPPRSVMATVFAATQRGRRGCRLGTIV